MSSEREEILRAIQQHLLDAAEQVGKLIEVKQENSGFRPKIDTAKAQAQVAEYNHAYWKAATLRATKPSIFDQCFHNTFPHWNAPKFVRTVRKRIGRFDELGAKRLFGALQQYEQRFGEFRKDHERVAAHQLAIDAVRESLAEKVEE